MDIHNQHPSHEVVVIVVPFIGYSHLDQLLRLSFLISSSYNIPVHYASPSTTFQAKLRFSHKDHPNFARIHFHEFPTPPFHSPPPPNTNADTFPEPLMPAIYLREPMAAFLLKISPTARRVIVIHDTVMSYVVQDIKTIPNAESYAFSPVSAFAFFFDTWHMMGKPFPVEDEPQGLPSIEGCYPPKLLNFMTYQYDFLKFSSGIITNSCRSIEGTYNDLIANKQIGENKKLWAIGPLNLPRKECDSRISSQQHKCLEWLDKQAPNSVLYVSFGTTISMTNEEIKELAMGLEESEQKFIWVLRDANIEKLFGDDDKGAELPEGYEERVKEVGLVVKDWAPQLEILGHPSTGGFMSHCGWNSCMESITMGVPMATWPTHTDQPKNAFLLTDILKVGLPVNQWAHQDDQVTSSIIAKAVKRLMASKEGEELRKKAEELGGASRQALKEGGVSRMQLDSFIAHITR